MKKRQNWAQGFPKKRKNEKTIPETARAHTPAQGDTQEDPPYANINTLSLSQPGGLPKGPGSHSQTPNASLAVV